MSNIANPEGVASRAESTEEELAHRMSNKVCEVCRKLRLPSPEYLSTTYAELKRTATAGCELCKLLRRATESAYTGANPMIRSEDNVGVGRYTNGDGAFLKVWRWQDEDMSGRSFNVTDAHTTNTNIADFYAALLLNTIPGKTYIACEYLKRPHWLPADKA